MAPGVAGCRLTTCASSFTCMPETLDRYRATTPRTSSPPVPPNHGTVVVELDRQRFLVDASILHGEPLPLSEVEPTRISHPAWGVDSRKQDGKWHIRWRPLHTPSGIDCRIERLGASAN